MTTDERIDRLTGVVETLAGTVIAHDSAIEALTSAASRHDSVLEALARAVTAPSAAVEAHDKQIGALIELVSKQREESDRLEQRWQAYLNTLRRQ
jgi:hypothetical protein